MTHSNQKHTPEPIWVKCSSQRPPNRSGSFRFRITAEILGLELAPEWTEEMHLCGMGHSEREWWPLSTQHWDGYRRYFTGDFEWRELTDKEAEVEGQNIVWHGLDLLPSPFTGKPPVVGYHGRWIGAPPNKAEWLSLKSHMVDSIGWRNAARMKKAWNTRPEHLKGGE